MLPLICSMNLTGGQFLRTAPLQYAVELCTYIIPNVSNKFSNPDKSVIFFQANSVFHLVACHCLLDISASSNYIWHFCSLFIDSAQATAQFPEGQHPAWKRQKRILFGLGMDF